MDGNEKKLARLPCPGQSNKSFSIFGLHFLLNSFRVRGKMKNTNAVNISQPFFLFWLSFSSALTAEGCNKTH